MAGIFINLPGAQTSIQDKGRFGYQSYGMCPSGAMDMRSLMIANILVGNSCRGQCCHVRPARLKYPRQVRHPQRF